MEAIIIGAGQAGLAAGYYLARQGRRFAILDAAPRLGHAWRTRYDSLRLFTSGPYDSLPGLPFPAPADHYPGKDEVADYLERYAATFELPVRLDTPVRALAGGRDGAPFRVVTDRGVLDAGQVIVATGPFQRPVVPPFAADLSPAVFRAHSSAYRNPAQIPDGEVLVVGAGNSGAQIAEELARTRRVTLAVGRTPPTLPQRLLGRDIFWWLHRLGVMAVTIDSRLGRRLSRADPLIGSRLRQLARARGVTLAGRVVGASVDTVSFADGASMKPAAIIWATGFRPDYDWIDLPVFDEAGRPVHRRGVTAISGLYFLGLPWLYRRGSALLGGVGEDAGYIAGRVAALAASRRATGRDDASVALAASR
jgi:putative flavoprotein involved in K+ transport